MQNNFISSTIFARCSLAAIGSITAGAMLLVTAGSSQAQSLTVLPVNIEMAPKQMATTLKVINQGDAETSVQIRVMAWKQTDGNEELTATDEVVISPPIATIAAGATQIVRLVLRHAPIAREATYRVLLDQIPPAAEAGTVRIALRLSIPVFAAPANRVASNVKFRIESKDGKTFLLAKNDGTRHETVREMAITASDGSGLKTEANNSPYILAGATRSWPIGAEGRVPAAGETLRLTGRMTTGAVDQRVAIVATP